MPVLLGKQPVWGIAQEETSLIVESVDFDFKLKDKPVLNKDGETYGMVLYDETCDISLKGEVPAEGAADYKLTAELALANAITDRFSSTQSGGRTIIKSIKETLSREDMVKIEVMSCFYPLIAAST